MTTQRLLRLSVLALTALLLAPPGARAHPHVWITMKSELVYAPDGSVIAIRHAWTFDDMYSTYATQGLDTERRGVIAGETLAALAEANINDLKEFNYFTVAKAAGRAVPFGDPDPKDTRLEFKDSLLTLHFTLPVKAPMKAPALDVEVFDPSYFVDFSFAENDAVTLVGAPAQCRLSAHKPTDGGVNAKPLSEADFLSASNYGAMFANKISVRCR